MDWSKFPPLASLRAFEAAARHRSHTAAAKELGVTHAAVAQQVRALEQHVGLTLASRSGKGLALTEEGLALGLAASAGFEQIAACLAELDAGAENRPLAITMTPTFAVSWFLPRMHRFRESHPGIELSINPTAHVVDLIAEKQDAAIRFGAGPWPGLEAEPLVASNFVIAAAPALIRGRDISSPEDLFQLPWLEEFGTEEIKGWLARRGIAAQSPKNVSRLPGYMMLSALREGQGVGATVRLFIEDDIAAGRLMVLFEDEIEQRRAAQRDARNQPLRRAGYNLVTRAGAKRPALKAFLTWIRREARRQETPEPGVTPLAEPGQPETGKG